MIKAPSRENKTDELALELDLLKIGNKEKRLHFYQDDNHLGPLKPKYYEQFPSDHYFTIMFDSRTTVGINRTSELTYQKNGSDFYHLKPDASNKLYTLKKYTNDRTIIPDGTYAYIIVVDNENGVELRIGQAHHFYLNEKRFNHVIIAGEITFKKGETGSEIININDKSGGYHVRSCDLKIYQYKIECIQHAIKAVGLPIEKFHFVYNLNNEAVLKVVINNPRRGIK